MFASKGEEKGCLGKTKNTPVWEVDKVQPEGRLGLRV